MATTPDALASDALYQNILYQSPIQFKQFHRSETNVIYLLRGRSTRNCSRLLYTRAIPQYSEVWELRGPGIQAFGSMAAGIHLEAVGDGIAFP